MEIKWGMEEDLSLQFWVKALKDAARNDVCRFNTALHLDSALQTSISRRSKLSERGIQSSVIRQIQISNSCNLHCRGCSLPAAPQLSAEQWLDRFDRDQNYGVLLELITGGEPLLRRDVLTAVQTRQDLYFPMVTNGMLIDRAAIDILKQSRNIIPLLALEGDAALTDARRGPGSYDLVLSKALLLAGEKLIFGFVIPLTTENERLLQNANFLHNLMQTGCSALILTDHPKECGCLHRSLLPGMRIKSIFQLIDALHRDNPALLTLCLGWE